MNRKFNTLSLLGAMLIVGLSGSLGVAQSVSQGTRQLFLDTVHGQNSEQSLEREIHGQLHQLLDQLRNAESDDEKQKLETELTELLRKQYDARLDAYDKHLTHLEDELKKMRDQLAKRRSAKEDMVRLRLEWYRAEANDLGWPQGNPGWRLSPFPGNRNIDGMFYSSPATTPGGRPFALPTTSVPAQTRGPLPAGAPDSTAPTGRAK